MYKLQISTFNTHRKTLYYCTKLTRYNAVIGTVVRNVSEARETHRKEPVKDVHIEYLRPNYHYRSTLYYIIGFTVFMVGVGFSSVPLYERFCSATNYAGTLSTDKVDFEKTRNLKRVPDKQISVLFNADKNARLQWNFKPLQSDIKVAPGETVLAFYTAENPTDKTISGISTYNITPFEAAQYFNKIQCFCFDEQQLNPHEQVDMPVFFYIDPEFATDPYLVGVDTITLSYTFFEAKEGLNLPFMPKY